MFMLRPEERLEVALARTSEITGPGVQWPEGGGVRKHKG